MAAKTTGTVPNQVCGYYIVIGDTLTSMQRFIQTIIEDTTHMTDNNRASMITQLGKLFITVPSHVTPLLTVDEKAHALVYDTALRTLGRLDHFEESALEYLFKHLTDDHAKVATFALKRRILLMGRDTAFPYIKRALETKDVKITARKEMFRLMVEAAVPNALQVLQQEIQRPKVHRDVVIAVLKTIRSSIALLRSDDAWRTIQSFAEDGQLDENIGYALLRDVTPFQFSNDNRSKYARLVFALTKNGNKFVHQEAMQTLASWCEFIAREIAEPVSQMVMNVEEPSWTHAITILIGCLNYTDGVNAVIELVKYLSAAPVPLSHNAAATYDLPMRQRLLELTRRLETMRKEMRDTYGHVLQALSELLASNDTYWQPSVALRLASLKWNDQASSTLISLAEYVSRLSPLFVPVLCSLVAKMLASGTSLDQGGIQLRNCKTANNNNIDPQVLLIIAERLSTRSVACKMLALSLLPAVSASNNGTGWSERAAALLRQLREDEDVAVRCTALHMFTDR